MTRINLNRDEVRIVVGPYGIDWFILLIKVKQLNDKFFLNTYANSFELKRAWMNHLKIQNDNEMTKPSKANTRYLCPSESSQVSTD